VLFGAEVAAGYQNAGSFQGEKLAAEASFASRELLTVSLMAVIASNFYHEQKPLSLVQLAGALNIPVRLANDLLTSLVDAKLVEHCAGETGACLPTRSLEKISVQDITDSLRLSGVDISVKNEVIRTVDQHLKKTSAANIDALSQVNLKDIVLLLNNSL
jgi:DNA-binding IscR family transcriptional regulator